MPSYNLNKTVANLAAFLYVRVNWFCQYYLCLRRNVAGFYCAWTSLRNVGKWWSEVELEKCWEEMEWGNDLFFVIPWYGFDRIVGSIFDQELHIWCVQTGSIIVSGLSVSLSSFAVFRGEIVLASELIHEVHDRAGLHDIFGGPMRVYDIG